MKKTRAIVIAAGVGNRLQPYTKTVPKCLVSVAGVSILHRTLATLRECGIDEIALVRGYRREQIAVTGARYFDNPHYEKNNVLHSLMYARSFLQEASACGQAVIVTYSDILFSKNHVASLQQQENATLLLTVDVNWRHRYVGRTQHPESEAEKCLFDLKNRVLKIGKSIDLGAKEGGEFTGLWKMTPDGITQFISAFDTVNKRIGLNERFRAASEWQKAYVTDLFQELVDTGSEVFVNPVHGGWMEIDTIQDLECANRLEFLGQPRQPYEIQ